MKKKNKTYTVTQLNKMMMRDDLSLWEIIEACAFISNNFTNITTSYSSFKLFCFPIVKIFNV